MPSDGETTIKNLRERVAAFARERDWDQFHSPKNLSMALAVEVAELMELFQWKTEQESWEVGRAPEGMARLREELADIGIFLLNLCNRLEVDLTAAVIDKLSENAKKYPVAQSRGSTKKYTELGE